MIFDVKPSSIHKKEISRFFSILILGDKLNIKYSFIIDTIISVYYKRMKKKFRAKHYNIERKVKA